MGTDTRLLMGEIIQDPSDEEKNVELLLVLFLRALVEEQKKLIEAGQ